MKKQNIITVLSLVMALTSVSSCNSKKNDDSPVSGGSGVLTSTQISGTSSVCRSGGSTFSSIGTTSYLESITLNTNESYTYEQYWFTGSVCQLGGTSLFRYGQSGTFDMGNLTTTPSNATEILLTVTSSYLQTFGSTFNSTAHYFETAFNTGAICGTNFSFPNTGGTDYSPGGATCGSLSPSWSLPMFPNNGETIHNVAILDTSARTLTVSDNTILWYPGSAGVSYPTTATKIFTNFH